MTIQNSKIKNNLLANPLSTEIDQIMYDAIKNYALQIEQEPKLTTIQKLNVLHWKIGEILYSKKNLNSDELKKIADYLNDLLPKNSQFSAEKLSEIQKFYKTYHNHVYLVNTLTRSQKFNLSFSQCIKLLFRYLRKKSQPLTVKEIGEALPIFKIPWHRNLIILNQKKLSRNEKLWYAKAALWYLDDNSNEDDVLATWIRHNLVIRSEYSETATEKDYCPKPLFFSYFCKDCKILGTPKGAHIDMPISMVLVFWFMILTLSIIFIKYGDLHSF